MPNHDHHTEPPVKLPVQRYRTVGDDYTKVLCRDCSTRATGVMIPSDETTAHDAWHEGNERMMKAAEIQPGDELRHADGSLSYRVLSVERDTVPSHDKVYAVVEHLDGGTERRAWLADDDVPLIHPRAAR